MAPKKAAPKATKTITKSPKKAAKAVKKAAKEKGDKPKKAPSPYINFCKEQRPKVIAANPGFSFGEVGKELGQQWKKLSEAEKAKYKEA